MRGELRRELVTSSGVRRQCDIWSERSSKNFAARTQSRPRKKRMIYQGEALFPTPAADLLAFALADKATERQTCAGPDGKNCLIPSGLLHTDPAGKAISVTSSELIFDTIQALGTGISKARDGHLIARIPSRQQLSDEVCVRRCRPRPGKFCELRAKFDELIRTGTSSITVNANAIRLPRLLHAQRGSARGQEQLRREVRYRVVSRSCLRI